jgi:hypothetical protein
MTVETVQEEHHHAVGRREGGEATTQMAPMMTNGNMATFAVGDRDPDLTATKPEQGGPRLNLSGGGTGLPVGRGPDGTTVTMGDDTPWGEPWLTAEMVVLATPMDPMSDGHAPT